MRRISKLTFLAAALLAFQARSSFAQAPLEGGPPASTTTTTTTTTSGVGATHGTGLGIGVLVPLVSPMGGASAAFDGGPWHLEGVLGLAKPNGSGDGARLSVIVGGRFWFHLHATANSDFSVGGGLAYFHAGPPDADALFVDGGGQFRAFLTSNVALSVTIGLGLATIDYNQLALGGNFIGGAGLHYYFY
jgi:hypothetical protein